MDNINILYKIDEWLEYQDKKKLDERDRKSHHPSGANKCMRQLYYDFTGEKVSNYRDATDIWRMNLGTWMHKMFALYLKDMGAYVEDEVEILVEHPDLKYPIHGYMDNLITIDDMTYGIELKIVFGRGAKSIQVSGKPREDDEIQSKVYLAFGDVAGYFVDYLARDSFYRTEFQIQMTAEQKDTFRRWMINKFKKLEWYVDNKIIPERDYFAIASDGMLKDKVQRKKVEYKSDWQCLYCVYRETCWAQELEDFGDHYERPEVDDE